MPVGNRFRLYPTREQQNILLRWIGCQRFIYNAKVSEDRYFRVFARKFGGDAPIDQEYSRFIGPDTQWLREVPSQVAPQRRDQMAAGLPEVLPQTRRPANDSEKARQTIRLAHCRAVPVYGRRAGDWQREVSSRTHSLHGTPRARASAVHLYLRSWGPLVCVVLYGEYRTGIR